MKFDFRIVNIKLLLPRAEALLTGHDKPLTPAQHEAVGKMIAAVQEVIVTFNGIGTTKSNNEPHAS